MRNIMSSTYNICKTYELTESVFFKLVKQHFVISSKINYPQPIFILLSLTLQFQRPAQSCACDWLVTKRCSQTRWERRSEPGHRKPSHHSNWMRSSGCRCSEDRKK